ncbi:MAG: ATP-binding protein [Microbacterium sp.]
MKRRSDTQVTSLLVPARETRAERRERVEAEAQIARALAAGQLAQAEALAAEKAALAELRRDVPRLGLPGPAQGRPRKRLRLRPHTDTTATLYAAFPFLAERGLGAEGMLIGSDVFSREAFYFDPWRLYAAGVITNPNMLIAGIVGKGKSSLAKSLVTRGLAFGRRAYVPADPKGEWSAVARAVGGQVIEVGPGSATRINPLDPGPRPSDVSDAEWPHMVRSRRLELLKSLAETIAPHPLTPVERSAVAAALDAATQRHEMPLLAHVVAYLFDPPAGAGLPAGFTGRDQLIADGRTAGHALQMMTAGDLTGVFDGPSTVVFDPAAPMVSVDLSRFGENSPHLPLVMAAMASWMEAAVRDPAGGLRFMVYDEAWRTMRHPALLRRMQSQWKLARAWGIANVLVIHRLSDLAAVGEVGSADRELAEGLLADCETRVIYAQQRDQVATTDSKIGLTSTEAEFIPNLEQAQGLWKIGERSFLVAHEWSEAEAAVFATDARMSEAAS